jgi:glycolate oxidase FAD binding subunit
MNAADSFSLAGVVPKSVIEPQTREDFAAAIGAAHASGEAIAIVGGGTELGLGAPPERLDRVVRTTHLDRVVEYAPADLVITVEAGMTLAALQATLAPHAQRLALDPPHADRATIGGLLATNDFGPARARYGTLRDAIVGISLVRADGTVVRGGGKVVKNVAGFDLPKIAVGSLGTLGAIATATLRLHPTPEVVRSIRVEFARADALRAFVAALIDERLEPAALDAERRADGSYELDVRFEGFATGAAEQVDRALALASKAAAPAHEIEIAPSRDATLRSFGTVRIRIAFPPATLAALDTRVLAPLASAFAESRITVYPTAGVAFAGGLPHANAESVVAALEGVRNELTVAGGHATVLEMPPELHRRIAPWGPPPAAFVLMRRLKTRFDPERTFNPGRFVGGL